MSWIDQGRQEHGWFGHGTAPTSLSDEMGGRAFAIVDLAADDFSNRNDLPFPLEKTTEVLRTFARLTAPWASLPPNAFRQRFFRDSFDPVDAWHLQQIMRGVASADNYAGLVSAGQDLATTIRSFGKQGWPLLLGGAVANFAPSKIDGSGGRAEPVQQVQYAPSAPLPVPLPPVPLPPQFTPGSRDNDELGVKPMIRLGRWIGDIFHSEQPDDGQQPPGSDDGGRSNAAPARQDKVPGYPRPVRDDEERYLVEAMLSGGRSTTDIDAMLDSWRKLNGRPGRIDLPENPDDLLEQGWIETSHPDAARAGHRKFRNSETGEELRFDEGEPGRPGARGKDHYHRLNPKSDRKREAYLDEYGNVVPKGSDDSHISPGGNNE